MDEGVGTVLMHRQAPLAFGVLASCAVIASGSILLREQILSFSSWPEAVGGGSAPEIAIPPARPLALGDAGAVRLGEVTRRFRAQAAPAGMLGGLGAGGGTFTLVLPRPVAVDGGSGGGATAGSGAPSGPQLTNTGRTGSGHPETGPVSDSPLSVYGEGIPVAGDAGSMGSGVSPTASGSVPLEPTAAIRVAAPQAADVAPEADLAPVISSVDNAPPPSDPVGTPVLVPEPSPEPAPTPDPAPAPTPAPAEPAPPADPTPPVEEPAPPPAEETPAPPVEAPAPDPAPEVPPAPADPTPPADPEIAPEPPADPVATDSAPAPIPAE
jgi:hypothetical protein